MKILDTIRSGAAKLLQGTKILANDVVLPNKLNKARWDLAGLEGKLAKLERTSDAFTTRTGQRVESREVAQLRTEVTVKRQEVDQLSQRVEARQEQVRDARMQVNRNMR